MPVHLILNQLRIINSMWVQRFEESFAAKVGADYAIAVNSGTSGLHAALMLQASEKVMR